MTRLLLTGALAGALAAAGFAAAPASAIVCPRGTTPKTLPTGHTVCVPFVHCDPVACPTVVECPTDIPVWSSTCRQIFGG